MRSATEHADSSIPYHFDSADTHCHFIRKYAMTEDMITMPHLEDASTKYFGIAFWAVPIVTKGAKSDKV